MESRDGKFQLKVKVMGWLWVGGIHEEGFWKIESSGS